MRMLFKIVLPSFVLLFVGSWTVAGAPPEKLAATNDPDKSPEAAKRAAVWKALLAKCRADKRAIRVYAENPVLTYVCFYSDDESQFIYDVAKNEVKQALLPHAIHRGINGITYEDSKKGGVFILWFYGQREGSIDPTKFEAGR